MSTNPLRIKIVIKSKALAKTSNKVALLITQGAENELGTQTSNEIEQ
jgi:hypothetical protein